MGNCRGSGKMRRSMCMVCEWYTGFPMPLGEASELPVAGCVKHSSHKSLCLMSQRRDLSSSADALKRASYFSQCNGGK